MNMRERSKQETLERGRVLIFSEKKEVVVVCFSVMRGRRRGKIVF